MSPGAYETCFCGNPLPSDTVDECAACAYARSQKWPIPGEGQNKFHVECDDGKIRRVTLDHYEQQGSRGWQAVVLYASRGRGIPAPPGGYADFIDPQRLLPGDS